MIIFKSTCFEHTDFRPFLFLSPYSFKRIWRFTARISGICSLDEKAAMFYCARDYSWKLCAAKMRNAVLSNNLKFVSSPSKRQVSSTSNTSDTRDWYEIQSFFPCRHRSAFHLNDDIYKTSYNLTNQRHFPFLLWVNNNNSLTAWGMIRLCNRPSIKKEKYSRRSLIRSLTSVF